LRRKHGFVNFGSQNDLCEFGRMSEELRTLRQYFRERDLFCCAVKRKLGRSCATCKGLTGFAAAGCITNMLLRKGRVSDEASTGAAGITFQSKVPIATVAPIYV
jgi:hypothetical protein